MAFSHDIEPQTSNPIGEVVAPVVPVAEVIFNAEDPRLGEMNREERVTQYYARELAVDNMDLLTPRFRLPEDGGDQEPWRDVLVADPLSDPRVSEIATILKASGFTQEQDIEKNP